MAAPASSVSSPNFTAVEAPFRYALAITPADGADIARPSHAIYATIRMCARRVRSTSTTATSIVALY